MLDDYVDENFVSVRGEAESYGGVFILYLYSSYSLQVLFTRSNNLANIANQIKLLLNRVYYYLMNVRKISPKMIQSALSTYE